jgi:uncharacterized iron-regulated protein
MLRAVAARIGALPKWSHALVFPFRRSVPMLFGMNTSKLADCVQNSEARSDLRQEMSVRPKMLRSRASVAVAGLVCLAQPWLVDAAVAAEKPWHGISNVCAAAQKPCLLFDMRAGGAEEMAGVPAEIFRRTDILLVGEIHDNPLHHRLQAAFVGELASSRKAATAVVMEHIRTDRSEELARYQSGVDRALPTFWVVAAARLGEALDWSKSGWPEWPQFLPIAEIAIRHGVPILAGDVPRAEIRRVAREGLAVLPEEARRRLGLDQPLSGPLRDALLVQLEASHCGLMPTSAFGAMAEAQRFRDAHLAEAAIIAARRYGSAVLVTGNEHARSDRGAPWYMRHLAPGLRVVTIAQVEAPDPATVNPLAVAPRGPDDKPAVDFLIVTPPQSRPDPCEDMRKRFGKKQK